MKNTISIRLSFAHTTAVCINILRSKANEKAKDEAATELIRYALELDRIDLLTNDFNQLKPKIKQL